MSQPKVVNLNPEARRTTQVPPIVHTVRQHTKRQLSELLQGLFNNTDDALFELADRSRSDQDQTMFFESMREIRLQRKRIATAFVSDFYQGFETIFQAQVSADEAAEESAEEMTLLRNDELEISVAVAGIVSKVTSQFSLPIMELTRRFDHLAKHQTVTERLNPLGPERLSKAFVTAIECLDVEIRVRIILLKLFERLVMERLGSVYEQANRLMSEAGVLTNIRETLRKSAKNPRPPATAARHSSQAGSMPSSAGGPGTVPGGGYGGDSGADSGGFGVIQRLLAGVRTEGGTASGYGGGAGTGAGGGLAGGTGGPASTGGFGGMAGGTTGDIGGMTGTGGAGSAGGSGGAAGVRESLMGTDNPAALISTPELLGFLTAAQTDTCAEPLDLNQIAPLIDMRQLVLARASNLEADANVKMGQNDEDVVSIVGMLFDFILNDRNLAIPMKALISRLQIPIIKLAILDKTFFEKNSHPARQLLNELSSAGIGWSSSAELKRDALYNKIESIVLRVLNGFSDDPGIFSELVDELRAFVKKDAKRHALVEQRVKETETGKALTQTAKETVQKLINQKACGLRLPAGVGRFISEIWSKVLVYVCLKYGTESGEWQLHVQTLDDLLWSLQPLSDMEDVVRRDKLIPDLLKKVRQGMRQVNLDEAKNDATAAELGDLLQEVAEHDRQYLAEDEPAPERREEQLESIEEIHLVEPVAAYQPENLPKPEPKFLDQLKRLSEGGWVEMQQDTGSVLRCKLATIIQPGDRYVFVNRRGIKVAETHRMHLAQQLQDGKLVLLDDSEVFDRALQAVVGNLRQMQNRPAKDGAEV